MQEPLGICPDAGARQKPCLTAEAGRRDKPIYFIVLVMVICVVPYLSIVPLKWVLLVSTKREIN
jgi:hypothetical protein